MVSSSFTTEGLVLAEYLGAKDAFEAAGDATAKVVVLAKASVAFLEGKDAKATETVLSMLNFLVCVDGVNTSAVSAVVEAIVSSSEANTEVRLKLLTVLFSTLPLPVRSGKSKATSTSTVHVTILTAILNYVQATKQWKVLLAAIKGLETTPVVVRASVEERTALFLLVSKLCGEAGEPEAQLQFLVAALRALKEAGSSEQAVEAASLALTSPRMMAVEEIQALESVKALETAEPLVYRLLKIVSAGDFAGFKTFVEGEGAAVFGKVAGVEVEALTKKMRILCLAGLAASAASFTFAQVAAAIGVEEDAAEEWVLAAITAGVINARIDQLEATVVVLGVKATSFDDSKEAWESLDAKLDTWRTNITALVKSLPN